MERFCHGVQETAAQLTRRRRTIQAIFFSVMSFAFFINKNIYIYIYTQPGDTEVREVNEFGKINKMSGNSTS